MTDKEAIERLKKGELGGLDALVLAYQDKAIRTATLITRDEELARDAVQETFYRIYRSIQGFNLDLPFEPYLLRSVVNTAINLAEKARRQVPLNDEVALSEVEALIHQAASTEDQVTYKLMKERIAAALDQISARERAVIVERYYLELSEKEMAGLHEVAPGTIKWWLHNARKHLRAFIGTEND